METKHTKGEWIITPMKCWKGEPILITHESKTGFVIAEITNQGNSRFISNKEEAEANAKLIAAAPKLLEALIELKSQFCGEKTPERLAAYKAELAIKSATE